MPQRRLIPLALAVLLLGSAGLVYLVLHDGDSDHSATGAGVLSSRAGAAGSEAALAALPAAGEGAGRDPLALLDGAPGSAALPADDTAAAAAQRGSVGGVVVDESGRTVAGEPVWLALVDDAWEPEPRDDKLPRLAGRTTSGADGRFRLDARAGATFELHAGGKAFAAARLSGVRAGDQLRVTLPPATQLAGSVVDAQTGQAVEGARVMGVQDAQSLLVDARPDGSFTLGPLPPDEVLVGAWAPGYDVTFVGNVAPAAGPVTLQLPPGQLLRGQLTDRVSEKPLPGGEVRLLLDVEGVRPGAEPVPVTHLVDERVTQADAEGRFEFEGAPSLGFALLCTAPGYLPERFDRFEGSEVVVVPMRPADAVAGHVVLAADGRPAGGAEVVLLSPDGELARTTSGPAGEFTLLAPQGPVERLLARPLHVEARSGDLVARQRLDRDPLDLVLELVPSLPLSVQVLDGGVPAPGAEVAARSKGAEATLAVSGADGLASLRHEPAGPNVSRLVLQARRGDLESLPLVLDPAALPSEALVLDLSQGGWFEGLVLDRAGQPVASARVSARPEQGDGPELRRASGHSDDQGRFRLGPLLPDVEHRVEARADVFLEQELRHLLPGPPPLELVLAPVVAWRGRTLDAAAGTPLPDFWGQLAAEYEEKGKLKERNTGERLHLAPGGTGEFWFELPGPGRYRIRLWARDHVAVASDPWDFDGVNPPPFATLALAPAAMLELTVLDGRGRPVPGYSVAVAPWELAEKAQAPAGDVRKKAVSSRTDELGVARLNLGEGGTYRVAGGPGLWLDDAPLTVTPGPPVARLYRLPPTTDLELHVTDDAGQPVSGAMIEVRTARDEKVHSVSRRVRTGSDPPGLALVQALPPASYDVFVRRRGFENAQQATVLSGVALERLDVKLVPRPADAAPAQGGVLQQGGKAR
jgi:hypothetical protein